MSKVIVIGGGAAGMMAAYQAAKCGNDVSLYEKNENFWKRTKSWGRNCSSLEKAVAM